VIRDAIKTLEDIQWKYGIGSDEYMKLQEIKTVFDLLKNALMDSLVDYVDEHYNGEFEEDDVAKARQYLGSEECEGLDDDEIIEAANDLQKEYYRSEASFDKLLDKAIEIYEE